MIRKKDLKDGAAPSPPHLSVRLAHGLVEGLVVVDGGLESHDIGRQGGDLAVLHPRGHTFNILQKTIASYHVALYATTYS